MTIPGDKKIEEEIRKAVMNKYTDYVQSVLGKLMPPK